MPPVSFAVLGCGSRGLDSYAPFAIRYPDQAKIVAVADPNEERRKEAQRQFGLKDEHCFVDWQTLTSCARLADAVIVATQDHDHVAPAIAAMEKGYHVLLEKPMAIREEDCRKIVDCAEASGVHLSVCHVLRYTPYFRKLREIVGSGVIGQLATVRHIEQVGFWHQAHSYVRGNWRNSGIASPMILAKCCHDLDILLFLLQRKCLSLSSFGNLLHFRPENAPHGASERCLDCTYSQSGCPYSASKFYQGLLKKGDFGWPLNVVTREFTEDALISALRSGPYGRCVYRCDNDVVDHQVVNMQFEGGVTASLTMTGFNAKSCRRTEILGSHGEIVGDGEVIEIRRFEDAEDSPEIFRFTDSDASLAGGHYGGDFGIMQDFVALIRGGDLSKNSSNPRVSLESHLMAFAAERSRLRNSVEILNT